MSAPGQLVSSAEVPFSVGSLAWSPDGRWVAAGAAAGFLFNIPSPVGGVGVVDVATGEVRWSRDVGRVWRLDVSADGRKLAVDSKDFSGTGDLRVMDTGSGDELWRIPGAGYPLFGPDDRLAVTVAGTSGAGGFSVVDAASGRPLRAFESKRSAKVFNFALTFSPDWRWVVSERAGHVVLFDVDTGAVRWETPTSSQILLTAFTADGRQVLVIDLRTVLVLDAETGAVRSDIAFRGGIPGFSTIKDAPLALSSDRRLVASVSTSDVRVFGLLDGRLGPTLPCPATNSLPKVSFDPEGHYVAVDRAIGDKKAPGVAVIDADAGALVWQDTTDFVFMIRFSPDGTRIAAGGRADGGGGFVRVYDTGVLPGRLTELSRCVHAAPVSLVAVSTAGTPMLATAAGEKASVFEADSGRLLLERPQPGALSSIAFTPDGRCFATGGTQGVRLFTTDSGVTLWKLERGPVNSIAISGGAGDWIAIATAGSDRSAQVVRRDDGAERWKLGHPSAVAHIAFSSGGQWVATGAGRSTRILDAATGAELYRHDHDGIVRALAFSPAGSLLATANDDGVVLLIDADTGGQRRPISHPRSVTSVAISPDGSLLATGSVDGIVRVLSLEGEPAVPMHQLAHDTPVTLLAFHPVDGRLAVATEDSFVWIVDPADGAVLQRLFQPAPVRHMAFSTDGGFFATAWADTASVYAVR